MLNSLAPKGRVMPAPGFKKAITFLTNPFASSYTRAAKNEEYKVAHSLDAFTHSADPKERVVAEAGLKLHDAVKAGDLSATTARKAMEQVQMALLAGLPGGSVGCVLGQVGVKAFQATEPGRAYHEEDFNQSTFVAKSFLDSMAQTDSGYQPLVDRTWALAHGEYHSSKTTVYGAALECGAKDDKWSTSKATALVAAETMPGMGDYSMNQLAVKALSWMASDNNTIAQEAKASYEQRSKQAHANMDKEPVHLDYSPALSHLYGVNRVLFDKAFKEIGAQES